MAIRRLVAALPALLLGILFSSPALAQSSRTDPAVVARLRADVMALTASRSRVPGTPGYARAAAYVESRFKQLGLSGVTSEKYNVTVPLTTRAGTLQLAGKTLPVLPMYPNGVVPSTTPKDGIKGALVYAGAGAPVNFNGKAVEGNIVALDFDSGMNWITAADLGARAIVFLEPAGAGARNMSRGEAERKFATLPVEMPRFYAEGAAAQSIRSLAAAPAGIPATLSATVTWEAVPAQNIVGTIPGTDAELGKQVIVIDGYFDSMSVSPDLAPGAEAAANCAALLELARSFKAKPAPYTLMFVANGAHHIALAGARNFAAQHFIDSTGKADDAAKEKMASLKAFIGLDLTSSTPTVGLFAKSAFYNQMGVGSENILLNQFNNFSKTLYEYAQSEAKRRGTQTEEFYVDGIRGLEGRSWRSYLPSLVALDSEVATMAQKPGLSFATANDARVRQDTAADVPANLKLENIAFQLATVNTVLGKALRSGDAKTNDFQELLSTLSLSNNYGYAVGRAIYRNNRQGASFLPDTPLPDANQPGKDRKTGEPFSKMYANMRAVAMVLDRTKDYKSYSGVRGAFIERAVYSSGKTGFPPASQFVFVGPRVGDSKGGGAPSSEVETYSVDDEGRVRFAPDMGSERQSFSPSFNKAAIPLSYKDQSTNELNVNATTIVFECRGVALYDTLDQRYFQILKELTALDAKTDATPVEYGYLRPQSPVGLAALEPVAVVFGKPSHAADNEFTRVKLIMAQGLLGKRLVLIEAKPQDKNFEGVGVAIPSAEDPAGASASRVSYRVARDLWTLDQQRIRLLKSFGINNERVDKLHEDAGGKSTEDVAAPTGGAISVAENALAARKYDTFYAQARRAFGLESRAYPDVEATAQDVLKGIIFYLALLLPFSFFLERLLFGYPDIRKQIIATGLLFLCVFGGISRVHPAFELALTPFIILLAFIILALTVVVTTFLSSKFEAEIKRMKQGVHFADVGRLSAISAALGLGIANMRRRPTRTILTCVTLVLLTFTVLSFTSVTASISNFARPYGDAGRTPKYSGMMVRQPDWSPLPERAVDSMTTEFSEKFGVAPALRAWYLSRDQGEPLQLRVANGANPNRYYYAPALLGLTAEEKSIGSPLPGSVLPGGRWFNPGERNVCLLPKSVLVRETAGPAAGDAASVSPDAPAATPTPAVVEGQDPNAPKDGLALGLTLDNAVGKSIDVGGQSFTVIGVFDDTGWTGADALRDLDDEPFTPVDYQNDQSKKAAADQTTSSAQGDEVQVQSYQHMNANALILLPYSDVLALGGTPRSVAVGFHDTVAGEEELQALMQRAALGIFGAVPDKDNGGKLSTKLYSSVESTNYEGFASLVVPILIAALIIANTMLGSVFERTREIGIYSSVGLAPIHVAALFIAEAIVYAVLGSISGYLVAQTVAKIVTATNLLPGITLNYSSSSAVLSTLIVMATVLLSTVYPARQASRMSQPDTDRKFQMSIPLGDLWRFQFPFTVSGQQPLGVAQFLADFFETHTDTSVGSFYTDQVRYTSLPLRQAVELLNELPEGVTMPVAEVRPVAAPEPVTIDGIPGAPSKAAKKPAKPAPTAAFKLLDLSEIAMDADAPINCLSMRVWLAPFDMGVSQDVDILLMPSDEPGLYELQLRLMRLSGEISAWRRVNRQFMSDLRKQLLLWRTIRPEGQQEYILRGRAHVAGEAIPVETPGAVVA